VIIISTFSEDEARDVSEVLAASMPPEWGWRIYLRGHEFRPPMRCAGCKQEIRRGAEERKRVEFRLQPDGSTKVFGWQMPDGDLDKASGQLVKVMHSKEYWVMVKAERRGIAP
jgi:hypothetical protein